MQTIIINIQCFLNFILEFKLKNQNNAFCKNTVIKLCNSISQIPRGNPVQKFSSGDGINTIS